MQGIKSINKRGYLVRGVFRGVIVLLAFGFCSCEGHSQPLPPSKGPSTTQELSASQGLSPSQGKNLVVTKVAITEYRTGYLYSDSNFYSFYNGDFIQYDFNDRKIVDVATGFNLLLALDDEGFVWSTRITDAICTRIDKDNTGAAFNGNTAIFGFGNTHTSIRADGSLWYWGEDFYNLYHSTGKINIERPVRISPKGMKVRKVVMGNKLLVLTRSGEVWDWSIGGGLTPVKRVVPRPAIDIFGSNFAYQGCIIPEPGGNQGGQLAGYPYIYGTDFSFWGGNDALEQPTSMKELWKVRSPIKEIAASSNTIHYIDVEGRMFGMGDNSQGEVGNGVELVNQSTYAKPHSWTFNKGEAYTGAPPVQIGAGIKWKKLFSNNFISFYKYALDEKDNLYSWGRNKALALGNGYLNMQEATYPNAMDVLVPTIVRPISSRFQTYTFTPPSISAGPEQTVKGSSVTLKGYATPPRLIKNTIVAANGIDTIGYKIVSYKWTRVSGRGGIINSPDSATTTVTGLTPGVYIFSLKATDNNTGTQQALVTITVSGR
ncbi:PKD domain-containing protein [Flavitalea flava]